MVTRRGFIGLVAGALGASAMPTLGWFDAAPPALAPEVAPIAMRHFRAIAGERGGKIAIFQGGDMLLSLAVAPLNCMDWFGSIMVGPNEQLRVEIEGDITWRAAGSDGRTYAWLGKEIIAQC